MTYRFYIETLNGELLEWQGLTLTQAKVMNSLTTKFCAHPNVANFGWEEMK